MIKNALTLRTEDSFECTDEKSTKIWSGYISYHFLTFLYLKYRRPASLINFIVSSIFKCRRKVAHEVDCVTIEPIIFSACDRPTVRKT